MTKTTDADYQTARQHSQAVHRWLLTVESMAMLGFAGVTVLLVTNVFASQFGLWPSHIGLAISFLFGALIFFGCRGSGVARKLVRFVLASFAIFLLAVGFNQLAVGYFDLDDGLRKAHARNLTFSRPAFFATWMDGTVARRNALYRSIAELNDARLDQVAEDLFFIEKSLVRSQMPDPRVHLLAYANLVRNRGQAEAFQTLIEENLVIQEQKEILPPLR